MQEKKIVPKPTSAFQARTDIGQNFLIDPSIVSFIVKQASLSKEDRVLEIGPGKGILTRALLESECSHLGVVEIDERLSPWLETLKSNPKFFLVWGDALRLDFQESFGWVPTKIIANLPYHITTPLLWAFLEQLSGKGLHYLLVMVQWEVACRLTAKEKSKERCPLGITLSAMGEAKIVKRVSPGSFRPIPKVDSALVEITLNKNFSLPRNPVWQRLLKAAFAQRRKTLCNNLMTAYGFDKKKVIGVLEQQGLPSLTRAEELKTEVWIQLTAILQETMGSASEKRDPTP